jgi:EmrB/QacA subfamily drug resistance transporter
MDRSLDRTHGLGPLMLMGLAVGPMLTTLDSSVLNVALPSISRAFGSSLGTIQWIASAYVLATAATLPLTAYLAKRLGTVTTYLASLIGFTTVSALCAVAPSAEALILLRILQGCLGAPLVPLAMGMFLGGGQGRARVPAMVGLMFFLAPALGPTIGGVLIDTVGWPSIFLINVPLGLAGIWAVTRLGLGEARDASAHLDVVGFALLAAASSLAIYGASEGPQVGWLDVGSMPFWASGLALAVVYLWWGPRQAQPALDIGLLRGRLAILGIAVCAIAAVVTYGVLILLPTYLQVARGASPIVAGLVLLPQGIVTALAFSLGGWLADRWGARLTAVAGMAVLMAGMLTLLVVDENTPIWAVSIVLCVRAFAVGLAIQPLLGAMLGGLARAATADFNTLFNVTQRVAGSIGISLVLTLFQVRESADVASALAGAGSHQALVAAGVAQALRETSLALVAIAVIGLALATLLPVDKTRVESFKPSLPVEA